MRRSRILARIRAGQPVWLATLWTVHHWKIVEMIALAGYDGVWIDMEHGACSPEAMAECLLAARAHDLDGVVRVARRGYTDLIQPLEAGATGLIVPQIADAAEAREFVRMARFAPLGWRGMGGSVDTDYGSVPLPEYLEHAARETFVMVMLERREAVAEVAAIAALPGLDGIYVGPADLSQSYNIPGQVGDPAIEAAIERVAAACAAQGKWWGLPARSPAEVRRRLAQGARFFSVANEMRVIAAGLRDTLAPYRELAP